MWCSDEEGKMDGDLNSPVADYIERERERFLNELVAFLRIPSVSADARYKDDVRAAAEYLCARLAELDLKASIEETAGNPVVYAESEQNPDRPTVLIYGHYDVQPPDPIDLWESGPFEPRIADGRIYARGAADDKGQLYAHVKAVEAYRKTGTPLPINVKFIAEGEEEIGGPSLPAFIDANLERLKADAVVISDGSFFGEHPSITYGLRGIVILEVNVFGPKQDIHSGMYGGAVDNPAMVLARMLAQLHDENGTVRVPGFYDDVRVLPDEDRRRLANLPFDESGLTAGAGVPELGGEKHLPVLERLWTRPTLEINGFTSGYSGEGSKTIIPSHANAKLSMRLVPHQTPETVGTCVEKFLREICPPTVRLESSGGHGARAALGPHDSPPMQAAARAITKGFGQEPVFVLEGGSIPVVVDFHERLGAPVVLMNFGKGDDNVHSPNEKLDLDHFYGGIKTSAYFLREMAAG